MYDRNRFCWVKVGTTGLVCMGLVGFGWVRLGFIGFAWIGFGVVRMGLHSWATDGFEGSGNSEIDNTMLSTNLL